ncbi:type II toxin-antitoxin system RelE/ParE family toxin [Kiloniella laminariae]|uniref:type II toxin-antitoxin system RelE/ParE family toxin n=1 Tax=Kiloniella laminariae TaxID=454162 RepID=UPI00037D892C|nr:type II toxin-antitoxin system RelE/ParE family toxin [Kiloniella laminariae]
MTAFCIQEAAAFRIDEIYCYTRDRWGEDQAVRYVEGLFEAFGKIGSQEIRSRPVPAEFGVTGYYFCYQKHFVYWKLLSNGDIGIVTILHERMHQIDRFKRNFEE